MADEEKEYRTQMSKMKGHRSYLTKLVNKISTFTDIPGPLPYMVLMEAEEHQELVKDRVNMLQEYFDELLGNIHLTDEDQENFFTYVSDVRKQLVTLKHKTASSRVQHTPESNNTQQSSSSFNSNVQYPNLKLPVFKGGPNGHREFRPFYQMFRALVHDKPEIPNIYKVQYLREQCLPEGSEARQLVSHIPPTAENYQLHIDTLKDRYQDDTGDANRLRRNLMSIGTWPVCKTVESQRKLIQHVRENLSLLNQIEEFECQDIKCLVVNLVSVLPERLRYKVAEMKKEERTVINIVQLLEDNIKTSLEVRSFTEQNRQDSSSKQQQSNSNNNRSSFHMYHSSSRSQEQSNRDTRPCIYCNGTRHTPHSCNIKSKEERADIVISSRRCWNCLSDTHSIKSCRVPSRCRCGNRDKHSASLCGVRPPWFTQSRDVSGASNQPTAQGTGLVAGDTLGAGDYLAMSRYLSTIVLDLPLRMGGSRPVRLLLDQCATHSYGLARTINLLSCKDMGKVGNITVSTFKGLRQVSSPRLVELKLPGNVHINLVVTDTICEPLHGHKLDDSIMRELSNYQLADASCVKESSLPIDILVGVDNFWKIVSDQVIRLKPELIVMSTLFGWVLSGEAPSCDYSKRFSTNLAHTLLSPGLNLENSSMNSTSCSHDTWNCLSTLGCKARESELSNSELSPCDCELLEPEFDLERFWDLDTLGIKPEREVSPVLEDFLDTLTHDSGSKRYTVRLPRKRNIENLQSNFSGSLRRLDSLATKFQKVENKEFTEKYKAIINDQLSEGIIEKVYLSEEERKSLQRDVSKPVLQFYIPHHGVVGKKLRVVMDASAHAYRGALSLNECLFAGPSLVNLLAEVLFCFRLHEIVLLADIKAAFLQIGVHTDDRDLLRFLWYNEKGELEVFRFTRVPFGTGPSPFLLNATLKYHLEKSVDDQSLLSLLLQSLYVDDILTGGPNVQFVLELQTQLKAILGEAAMTLHGWDSNSVEVRSSLEVTSENDTKKVLGVFWNRVHDELHLNLEKLLINRKKVLSKRDLLSSTAQFFDPHGWLNPVVLIPKLLFQSVCGKKLSWDDPLPDEASSKWSNFRSQLHFLEKVRVHRHILLSNADRIELHGFSDASQSAYAACVYVKSSRGNETICRLAMSKSRVAPKKSLSIPRLELMGALLLARLMAMVIAFLKHVKIDAVIYYTDSMNVLYWIRTEHKMWAVFVACRIREINALSKFEDWKYVRTDMNPADLGTRGLMPSEIVGNDLWWYGPKFLVEGRTEPEIDSIHPPTACLQERRKSVHVIVPLSLGVGSIIKYQDFSRLHRLFSHTVVVLKAAHCFISMVKHRRDPVPLSLPELHSKARTLWICSIQLEFYHEEVQFLKHNPTKIPNGMKVPSSLVKQLDLFLDHQGIMRSRTRLQDAMISDHVKFPILLPRDCHFTSLLVLEAHLRLHHAGVRQVMSSVRGFYYVPQCRRVISKVVRSCVSCRRQDAGFYPVPDPPPLPDFRVAKVDVFEHVGVDHCGPLYTKEGKVLKKQYVLIITCAVARAVHLELVSDMSVKCFMLGFRKFVSRRGLPSFIMSDNSLTFQCANRELTAILNHQRFQGYFMKKGIKWQHYLEYAPWWGGWIEVLNRIFKSSMYKVLGGSNVSFDELSTLLCEIEAIMNSRPISYVYDDIHEGQAITPSLLLCGKDLTQLPAGMFNHKFDRKQPQTCRERLKYLEKLKTYFWTRYTREYLTELSDRHLTQRHGKEVREPKVDDIVLVKEGSDTVKIPRHKWKVARVVQLHPGRDGRVRSVDINLTQEGKPLVLRHYSPRKLVPLEGDLEEQK